MTQAFIDSDVLLDMITGRLPFSKEAAALFTLFDKKHLKGYVSSLSFSNLYYVLRKYTSHTKVINSLQELSDLIEIVNVDQVIVKTALKSAFKDFEDALQCYSAQSNPEVEVIITRNIKDFKNSELPVMTPETFLRTIAQINEATG